MKLFSFLVLIFAFLGNSKASAFVNAVHILNNLEVAHDIEVDAQETRIAKSLSIDQVRILVRGLEKIDKEDQNFHQNRSLDRLTFYYTSRLRS